MASHCADVGMSDNKITPTSIESDAFKNYIRPVNLVKREQRQHNSSECEIVWTLLLRKTCIFLITFNALLYDCWCYFNSYN